MVFLTLPCCLAGPGLKTCCDSQVLELAMHGTNVLTSLNDGWILQCDIQAILTKYHATSEQAKQKEWIEIRARPNVPVGEITRVYELVRSTGITNIDCTVEGYKFLIEAPVAPSEPSPVNQRHFQKETSVDMLMRAEWQRLKGTNSPQSSREQ
jgi:hypothetical protein